MTKLRYLDPNKNRELLAFCYVLALDAGNAAVMEAVLAACLNDPELDRIIEEIYVALSEELELDPPPACVPMFLRRSDD